MGPAERALRERLSSTGLTMADAQRMGGTHAALLLGLVTRREVVLCSDGKYRPRRPPAVPPSPPPPTRPSPPPRRPPVQLSLDTASKLAEIRADVQRRAEEERAAAERRRQEVERWRRVEAEKRAQIEAEHNARRERERAAEVERRRQLDDLMRQEAARRAREQEERRLWANLDAYPKREERQLVIAERTSALALAQQLLRGDS